MTVLAASLVVLVEALLTLVYALDAVFIAKLVSLETVFALVAIAIAGGWAVAAVDSIPIVELYTTADWFAAIGTAPEGTGAAKRL